MMRKKRISTTLEEATWLKYGFVKAEAMGHLKRDVSFSAMSNIAIQLCPTDRILDAVRKNMLGLRAKRRLIE